MNATYCRDYMKIASKLTVLKTFISMNAIYFVAACAYSMLATALFLIRTKQLRWKFVKYLAFPIKSA